MFYYTYLLKSLKDKKWYTGCTSDLHARLKLHNDGKIRSTRKRCPFDLLYYEACKDKRDAYAREKFLKTGMGKRYLKNRLNKFLTG